MGSLRFNQSEYPTLHYSNFHPPEDTALNKIDPIRYEMFLHRLWAIGEEGRMTLQQVTASPIVSQGGECMSSFYDAKGTMVLACSGHLRFAAATSDAITSLKQRFDKYQELFNHYLSFFTYSIIHC